MVRFEVALCVFLSARQTAAHCSYATDTDTDSNSGTDKATGNQGTGTAGAAWHKTINI